MNKIKTSLIIPTYNGKNKLPATLTAINQQTIPPDEIIIVIDGSTDESETWIKQNFDFSNLLIISQKNGGRAKSRNTGVKHARGDIIIFIDDDIEVRKNFIENHIAVHLEHPYSIVTGAAWQAHKHDATDIDKDFFKFREFIESRWKESFPENSPLYKASFKKFGCSFANCSFPKDVYTSLNGIDEKLKDHEDFDFGIRALEQNICLYHAPFIKTSHRDFSGIEAYINRHVQLYKENLRLAEIHPHYKELFPERFSLPARNRIKNKFKFIFYFNKTWKKIIESKVFLTFTTAKIRFKIYEYIIYSTISRRSI